MESYVRIAERALGKPLPDGAVVHHADSDRTNNSNSNLVICPDRFYHALLHVRLAALRECGNPALRKCCICKEYDDPAQMRGVGHIGVLQYSHSRCQKAYQLGRKTKTDRLEKSYREIISRLHKKFHLGQSGEEVSRTPSFDDPLTTQILTTIAASKDSEYRFHSVKVKALIQARGGLKVVAAALHTTERTLQRTMRNHSLNGRLQRDLVHFLGVHSDKIGYFIERTLRDERRA